MITACALLSAAALWLWCRPYPGIVHDARLYLGRALADIDPNGLGQQLNYLHDGQTQYTVFRVLTVLLVRSLGIGPAAESLAFAGLALWGAAAAYLLSALFRGRLLWSAFVCVAVLPPLYGGFHIFSYGESFANPRTFSEAAGLLAIGAMLGGRLLVALAALAVAGAFHPIMAAPAGSVILCLLCLRDRRWLFAAATAFVALVAAAVAGLPVADRLFAVMDPTWKDVVANLQPDLFPKLWSLGSWTLLASQFGLVVLATTLATGNVRRLLVAVTAVTLISILVAAILPSLLVLQLQLWRAQWVLAFLTAATLPLTATELWRRGGRSRVAILVVAVVWLARSYGYVEFAALGLLGVVRLPPLPKPIERPFSVSAAALAMLALTTLLAIPILAEAVSVNAKHQFLLSDYITFLYVSYSFVVMASVAVAIGAGWLDLQERKTRRAVGAITLVLVCSSILSWDRRSVLQRDEERAAGASQLRQVVSAGSVLWLGGDGTTWLWTGRPEWWDYYQAAGVVFDRELALTWRDRFESLVDAGLMTEADRVTRDDDPPHRVHDATPAGLSALCGRADHPTWVIAPIENVRDHLAPAAYRIWRAPVAARKFDQGQLKYLQDFAVVACSDFAGPRAT